MFSTETCLAIQYATSSLQTAIVSDRKIFTLIIKHITLYHFSASSMGYHLTVFLIIQPHPVSAIYGQKFRRRKKPALQVLSTVFIIRADTSTTSKHFRNGTESVWIDLEHDELKVGGPVVPNSYWLSVGDDGVLRMGFTELCDKTFHDKPLVNVLLSFLKIQTGANTQ